jgi:hypothetical protein
MRAEDLLELLRTRPFRPFRILATDGRAYKVRHPDRALALRSQIILPVPAEARVPEGTERLALEDVIGAEQTSEGPASAGT